MLHDHSKDRRRPHVRMQPSTILDQQDDEGDVSYFDDQDHMDFIGEFTFKVNETCLSSDHNIFMVAPTDKDAHNPILVHLKPSDMIWKEKRTYIPRQKKQERKERRKATQKSNKRKGFGDGPLLDESWRNWDGSGNWVRDDDDHPGYGDSSSSTSWAWRPKNR